MIGYDVTLAAPLRRLEEPPGEAVLIVGLGDSLDVIEPSGRRRTLRAFAVPIGVEPSITEQRGRQLGVEVRLSPLAARRVLGVPMHELSPHGTELEEIVGDAEARELTERMALASDWDDRCALLRNFAAARVAQSPPPRPELAWAWQRLHDPRARVAHIAREINWSPRHLSARFRDAVGVTPKEAARVLRFRRVVAGLHAGSSLADLAFDAGYYDQAHLNRDFRAFAGCAPGEFPFVQDSSPALT